MDILSSIANIIRLQICAEGNSIFILHNISYDTYIFPRLQALTITFHPLERYANTFFRLIQRHPHLKIFLVAFHTSEHRRHPPPTFSDPIILPELQVCRGPLKVLKHILPKASSLSSLSLDLIELAGFHLDMVERHLAPLSQFSMIRERLHSTPPFRFHLVLQAFDIVVIDATFRSLPNDTINLAIQCGYVNNPARRVGVFLFRVIGAAANHDSFPTCT
ncbi:hypothetical protein D9758_004588 [Tetrapyrgos nigripes]|uniref:Uncharacterized protein n=1 Tax=Tetrapyrgos nigripes TaxID=182062 RepID=A0A8H5H036_9AGAR|nr:hypothetical protein D9758_004588 [Tetrapyrgos nigripes]